MGTTSAMASTVCTRGLQVPGDYITLANTRIGSQMLVRVIDLVEQGAGLRIGAVMRL
jgi:hypothetical protein